MGIPLPDPRRPLKNLNHEKFCHNRVRGLGKYEAYMDAFSSGSHKPTGRTASAGATALLKRMEVIARIDFLMEQCAEEAIKSRNWISSQLQTVADRCMQKVPALDKSGKECGVWKFDGPTAVKVYHLMGKDLGMFKDQLEVSGIDAELHERSNPEIMLMIEAMALSLGRDFIRQLGEKVGIIEPASGGKAAGGAAEAQDQPLPSVH